MATDTISCRDLYLRYTAKDGKSTVRQHRVWDADRFITARIDEGANPKKPEDAFVVSLATAEDYRGRK